MKRSTIAQIRPNTPVSMYWRVVAFALWMVVAQSAMAIHLTDQLAHSSDEACEICQAAERIAPPAIGTLQLVSTPFDIRVDRPLAATPQCRITTYHLPPCRAPPLQLTP